MHDESAMSVDLKRASVITVTASNEETLTWREPPLLTNASSLTTTTWSKHLDQNGDKEFSSKEVDAHEADHKLARLTGAVRVILDCLDDQPDRDGLRDTPKRYAKAMLFFTKGYRENIETVINGAIFEDNCNELVTVHDIEVHSMCEHHLVPFTGKIHIGYIPRGKVLGLSKFARIVEMYARRLQIQERLTREVATAIQTVLQPEGVAVVMESSHMCMVMRGVQKQCSLTTTQCMLGSMKTDRTVKEDFLSSLARRRH